MTGVPGLDIVACMSNRCLAPILLLSCWWLAACPASSDPAATDTRVDAGPDVGLADLSPAPYSCEYESAGPYSKAAIDECSLLDQDCAQEEKGCYITSQGARCLNAGTLECNEPCEFLDDCPRATVCVGTPSSCRALCRLGDDCPNGTRCREMAGRDDVGFCPEACSLFGERDHCPAGSGCYLVGERQECVPTAGPGLSEGQPCLSPEECQPGLICQDAQDLRCLRPCRTDGQAPCPNDGECTALIGLEPLGACLDQATSRDR